jgi:adenylyl-sulfate kinase
MSNTPHSPNVVPQKTAVTREDRARVAGQRGVVLWFTGLSGSGKSTVASAVEAALNAAGRLTYLLDGDNIRHGLNGDLGFSDKDRVENIRRVAHVSKLFWDANVITLVSFISPFKAERALARELIGNDFVEVFVDTPLEVCEQRDVKGLYKKARAGEIASFTGISSPYEAPEQPEIRLRTAEETLEQSTEQVLAFLKTRGYIAV